MTNQRPRTRPISVYVHGGVVASLLLVFAAMWLSSPPGSGGGANIGAGIALLPILALGAPWTLPLIIDPYRFDDLPDVVMYLWWIGPAVLNVGIHHGLWRVTGARRRAEPPR